MIVSISHRVGTTYDVTHDIGEYGMCQSLIESVQQLCFQRLLFLLYSFSAFFQAVSAKKSVDDEKCKIPKVLKILDYQVLPEF